MAELLLKSSQFSFRVHVLNHYSSLSFSVLKHLGLILPQDVFIPSWTKQAVYGLYLAIVLP